MNKVLAPRHLDIPPTTYCVAPGLSPTKASDPQTGGITVLWNPFMVVRIGGLPCRAATSMGDSSTALHLDLIALERRAAAAMAEHVCRTLESHIHNFIAGGDRRTARQALQLKRDFYNLRVPRKAITSGVAATVGQPLSDQINSLSNKLQEIAYLIAQKDKVYHQETIRGYAALAGWLGHPSLYGALEISNPAFLESIEKARMLLHSGPSNRKEVNAAFGTLARYILRSSLKTSQLSSFGIAVVIGIDVQVDNRGATSLEMRSGNLSAIRRVIELRRAIVEHPLIMLLRKPSSLRDGVKVRLARLDRRGNRHIWSNVTADEAPATRTRGAGHRRLTSASSLPELLSRIYNDRNCETILLRDLRKALAGDSMANSHDVENIIERAFASGLLTVELSTTTQESATEWVRSASLHLTERLAEQVCDRFGHLMTALDRLRATPVGSRKETLQDLESTFQSYLDVEGSSGKAALSRPLVHEDCSGDDNVDSDIEHLFIASKDDIAEAIKLVAVLSSNGERQSELERLWRFFVARFGESGVCHDVGSFFLDFAEHRFSAEKTADRGEEYTASSNASDNFRNRVLASISGQTAVQLDDIVSSREVDALLRRSGKSRLSQTLLGFFVRNPTSEAKFVLNQIYPGMGRIISRFLNGSHAPRMADYFDHVAAPACPAAVPGTFGFNANIHPQCMRHEVAVPSYPADHSSSEKVHLDDLALRMDPNTKRLLLNDRQGLAIEPLYIGSLVPHALPPIQRYLAFLSEGAEEIQSLWTTLLAPKIIDSDSVVCLPRVSYRRVVLVRNTIWSPHALLPDASLDETSFFEAMLDWANQHELPQLCYFHRRDGLSLFPRQQGALGASVYAELARKMSKPLPLDIRSVISVRLLHKSLSLHRDDVIFTEAYPAPDLCHVGINTEQHLAETAIELTLKINR